MTPPRKGSIAVCSLGLAGQITCKKPEKVEYPDGTTAVAWVGIHLDDHPERGIQKGDPWSSRNPQVLF